MPNWCNNSLTITGSTESIKDLWESAQAADGLLQAIKPMPAELEGTTSPGESPNWYDWRVNNWGTKWDVDLHGLEFTDRGDGTAEISGWFDSAWSPPIEAMQTLADDFDSCYVELMYMESGMAFVGCWDSDGADDHYEYDGCSSDNVRDFIPDYLVDHYDLENLLAEYEEEEGEDVDLTDLSPNTV